MFKAIKKWLNKETDTEMDVENKYQPCEVMLKLADVVETGKYEEDFFYGRYQREIYRGNVRVERSTSTDGFSFIYVFIDFCNFTITQEQENFLHKKFNERIEIEEVKKPPHKEQQTKLRESILKADTGEKPMELYIADLPTPTKRW